MLDSIAHIYYTNSSYFVHILSDSMSIKKVISITNGLILLITDKYEKTLDILDILYNTDDKV